MKVNIIQPQISTFENLKVGQVFRGGDVGIYIKIDDTSVCCIKKIMGLMGEEGKILKFQSAASCAIISEATFTVGVQ